MESGTYAAGSGYPPFLAEPGDLLLLYCTDEYPGFPKQVPGIGRVVSADRDEIRDRWMPLALPIPKEILDQSFEPEDKKKMTELRFNTRRVFTITE